MLLKAVLHLKNRQSQCKRAIKHKMNKGWIMLHRQILDNPIIRKPNYCHLWVTLLLKAAHKGKDFIWNNEKQSLLPGQLLTGRTKLAEQTGIAPSTVEHILKYLESEQQIEQQTTQKFRIITIKNWEKYQGGKRNEQQMNTYNNVKNVNNEKKYSQNSDEFRLSSLLLDLIIQRKPDYRNGQPGCRDVTLQRWAVHVGRMIRLDSRKPERIEKVIRWCQQDDFWQNNVLSTEKLRKHFDKLEMENNKNDSRTNRRDTGEQPYIR